MTGNNNLNSETRWLDSLPILIDGRVLITPRDSNTLFCLNQRDGRLLWKQPRGEGLSLAGVYEGKVVVVERSQVRAVHLKDGMPAWKRPLMIPLPSGCGVRTGRLFHLPLTTAEIVTIDLQTGRILARAPSRTGEVAGNLVSSDGVMVTQSFGRLVGFKPLKSLRTETQERLKKNPRDADALALRGTVRLHRGLEKDGLADLRQAVRINPNSKAREVLVTTLLEGLRFDFAAYRHTAAEIERLARNPRQKSRYLRLYAGGLQQVGEQRAALTEYLKLVDGDGIPAELEMISGSLSVRTDRWLRTRFAELYREADANERDRMRTVLRERLNTAFQKKSPARLRGFLESFAELPIAESARKALVEQLDEKNSSSELALQLERLRHAESRETAAYATARLARLLIDAQQFDGRLGQLLDDLDTRWTDVVCLDKKTGRQLSALWRGLPHVADTLSMSEDWSRSGAVNVARRYRHGSYQQIYSVPFVADSGLVFRDWLLKINQSAQMLIATDSTGRQRWRLSLKRTPHQARFAQLSPNGNYALAQGHLLVVVLGSRFLVLDTFSATAKAPPKVLWQKYLYRHRSAWTGRRTNLVNPRWIVLPNGQRQVRLLDASLQPMGTVGLMTPEMICYQVGTTLYAADPLTGSTLWERRNVPRGGRIFGDDQHVFLSPPNSEQVVVFRAGDGVRLGEWALPGISTPLTIRGRTILTRTTTGSKRQLSLLDALTRQTVWKKEMTPSAQVALVGHDEVAVLEPDGRFLVADIDSGADRLRATVEADKGLDRITVRRSRDRYVLLTHHPIQKQKKLRILPLAYHYPLVNGLTYGFSRRTKRQIWKTTIAQQSFDPDQPSELPILVFTVRRYRQVLRGQRSQPIRKPYTIAIVDVRTGQLIYSSDETVAMVKFELRVDHLHHMIDIELYRLAIRLMFSDPHATPVKAEKP